MQVPNAAPAGPPAHPLEARHRLYNPDELFDWIQAGAGARLGPGEFPTTNAALVPFHAPLDYQGLELVRRRFTWRPLLQAPIRTQGRSHTSVADSVSKMDGPKRLRFVYRSASLWGNLKTYAQRPGQQPLGTRPASPASYPTVNATLVRVGGGDPVVTAFTRSAWTDADHDLADVQQQTRAVCALAELYSTWLREYKVPMIVNSEPAVQDAFYRQLLIPLESTILTRYQVTRTPDWWESWNKGSQLNVPQQMYPDADDIRTSLEHVRYPFWGRAVPGEHAVPQAGTKKAGFPDFLLYNQPDASGGEHAALGEVKTFWSYKTERIAGLWTEGRITHDVDNEVCRFDWQTIGLQGAMMQQLWGELHFLETRFAFWTNGEVIMFCIVTNDALNHKELTCTPLYNLKDNPDVPIVLAGFTFAALNYLRDVDDIIDALVPQQDKCW